MYNTSLSLISDSQFPSGDIQIKYGDDLTYPNFHGIWPFTQPRRTVPLYSATNPPVLHKKGKGIGVTESGLMRICQSLRWITIVLYPYTSAILLDQYSKNLRLLLLCCMFPAATETVVIAAAVVLCILIVTISVLAGFRFWIRRRSNYTEFTDDHDIRYGQFNDLHKSIMQFLLQRCSSWTIINIFFFTH